MKKKILILFLISISFGSLINAKSMLPSESDNVIIVPTVILGQNYPNPAKGKTVINIEFTSAKATLKIYDVLGILVEEVVITKDKKVINLDVSEYKEGIYLYTLEADGQKITRRMTVKK